MDAYRRMVCALAGAAIFAIPSLLHAADAPSEFLDIHPELRADPDLAGVLTWERAGFDRVGFRKVMFAPLTVFVDPDSEYKGFDADDVQALASGFRERIARTLGPEIAIVDAPGGGVLYVRAALTHVKLSKSPRGLLSYTPVGIVVTAVRDAAGKRILLQDASLELEAYDAATGEPVAVLVDRRAAARGGAGEPSWKNIEDTFDSFAARFKSRVLAARAP